MTSAFLNLNLLILLNRLTRSALRWTTIFAPQAERGWEQICHAGRSALLAGKRNL
jgi:hypothetical protein